MYNILIIEDNKSISNLIKIHLDMQGYISHIANNGQEGLDLIKPSIDLIILDLMLPDMSGLDLIDPITKLGIPIIILSARDQLEVKVTGFQLGADDYLTKPFESVELIMRVKALLNRTKKARKEVTIEDILINFDQRCVHKNKEAVTMTTKEFDLLAYFIRNQNIALSREQILEEIWGYDYYGQSRTVDMHVQRLRAKLAIKIKTVYKYGYRLENL